jgi:hypothetical protein
MESNFSVLLYSKYSANSKQLMDVMNSSKVDFLKSTGLQNLCVDNEEVRNRIIQNKQINITSVPCILVIFPDGIIEKYEGLHTFKWVEEIISSFKSTRAQLSNEQSSNELKHLEHLELQKQLAHERQLERDRQDRERDRQDRERDRQDRDRREKQEERDREREQNREKHETLEQNREKQSEQNRQQPREQNRQQPREQNRQQREKQSEQNREQNDAPKQHNRKKVVKKQNDNLDTFKSIPKPVARIRENSGNYSQIDDLFQGEEVVDARRTVKSNTSSKNDSANDIMSKAKELAKLRESDAAPPPPGHPSNNQK